MGLSSDLQRTKLDRLVGRVLAADECVQLWWLYSVLESMPSHSQIPGRPLGRISPIFKEKKIQNEKNCHNLHWYDRGYPFLKSSPANRYSRIWSKLPQ